MRIQANARLWLAIAPIAFAMTIVSPSRAFAMRHFHHRKSATTAAQATGATHPYRGLLLEDADSGKILYQLNADMPWPPASMAKMMLLMVAEDQLKAHRVTLNDPVRVSERAEHTGGTRVGLRAGDVYPLRELMLAAVVHSANDAAVAIAEKIAGSVEGCVHEMNESARGLGMTSTTYNTVDGLPPRPAHDVDSTTARDLAVLARALIHNTDILKWSSLEQTYFGNPPVLYKNTNHLIGTFDGCDGLKTGFTSQAGFNLTATARRRDMRLVAVVLGAPSNFQRFNQAAILMDWGFDNFAKVSMLKQGQPLPVQVQVESGPIIQPVAADDLSLVVPKKELRDLRLDYRVPTQISGPLATGAPVGEVLLRDRGAVLTKVAAVCPVGTAPPPPLAVDPAGNSAYRDSLDYPIPPPSNSGQ